MGKANIALPEAGPADPAARCGDDLRPLAVFDLDGTLTTRSTFLPFLLTWSRRRRRLGPLFPLPFQLSAYMLRLKQDAALKQRLMVGFFAGASSEELEEHSNWFCRNWLPRRLHPVGMRHLKQHQQEGHRIVLLSASPDIYVSDVARTLGIAEVVCTRVASEGGLCLGTIAGTNCKGAAKLEALTRYLGLDTAPAESFAYGDSWHDLPVLSWVAEGRVVRRRSSLPVEFIKQFSRT